MYEGENTITFSKRYLENNELPRIDFGFFNRRTAQTDNALIDSLRTALENCDALIFNQQMPGSINNPDFIAQANKLFDEFNDKIILLDSRHYGNKFKNVYRKTNDIENDNIGLGFFGETPIAQPQVEVNAGSMHAHLVTIGLIGSVA